MQPTELRGRDAERDALFGALDATARGHGRVALVSGPAGIGKTSLAEMLAAEAASRGFGVLRGRAWEFAEAPPYFPVASALRSLGIDAQGVAGSAFELWESVLEALANRAASAPVVWLLEDLHAADLQTLDLLAFLAQPVRALPVLIVATARRGDPRTGERGAQRLVRLARDGLDLSLSPLGRVEIAALAAEHLGRPLATGELDALVARTEGNPLFVVELARAARAMGASGRAARLPETIRQLVQDRLARLPHETQRALEAGAILGREFTARDVAHMSGTLPARIVDALLPALDAGLILERQPGAFAFGHVLERDAIEESLTPAARSAIHSRAEVALRRAGDAPHVLLERARHALSGAACTDDGATRDLLALIDRAMTELETRGAYDRALALGLRLEAARAAGVVATPATSEEMLRMATVAQRAGHHAECRRFCAEVTHRARVASDGRLLAHAALRMGAELRPGVVDGELVSQLREARAALDQSEQALGCLLDARIAAALQPAPDPLAVAAIARETIERARALGDDALVAEVLVFAGAAMVDYAPVTERIALARELFSRAQRTRDAEKMLRARARIAMDSIELGELAAFADEVDAMLDGSLELGQARHRWRPLLFASMRAMMRGDFDESERWLVEVEQLASVIDDPALHLSLGAHRILRARDIDGAEELEALGRRVPEILEGIPLKDRVAALLRAFVRCRAGDREGTAADLAIVGPVQRPFLDDRPFSAMLAESNAFAGPREFCGTLRSHIERWEGDLTTGHIPFTFEGPVSRLVGLLDAALGDAAGAEGHLRAALDRVNRQGLRPWIARLSCELGEVLEGMGRKEEAAALLDEAASIAQALGMANLIERLGAVAAPSGRPEPSSRGAIAVEVVRDGDGWRVTRGDRTVRVRDSRGMQLLARLVEQPGEELHVLVLASNEGQALAETNAGDRIDEKALRAYRARLSEIGRDLEDARAMGDRGRAERLDCERGALEAEISASLGLGGEARKAGSVTERARVAVQKRLKDALLRVSMVDVALGSELHRAVRTGTYCSFRP
jgi:tetratricopeptide (TPR) repeat protein